MTYPKIIKLESEKLKKLLTEKAELITAGRAKSEDIEKLEADMDEVDKQLQEEEKKVNIDDILEREKVITAKVNEAIKEMEVIKSDIFLRMKEQTSPELRLKYEELKAKKDEAETERNKIAIKAQKYNDKIVPLGRKLMKPLLEDKYEDYDSITLEAGEIVATVFSHLNDFEVTFNKKNAI